MEVCSCTVKFLLFVFNLLCALVGLAILGTSVYFYLETNTVKDLLLHGSITTLFIVMLVLGAVTFIVAFLGCCGAVNEYPCCINTYATLLSIILVCQLALAGYFIYASNSQDLEEDIRKTVEREFANYKENKKLVDFVQEYLQCCGVSGPAYFEVLPDSCCPRSETNILSNIGFSGISCTIINAYQQGCASRVVNFLSGNCKYGAITLFAIGGVELLCIICAFCLSHSIKRERHSNQNYYNISQFR